MRSVGEAVGYALTDERVLLAGSAAPLVPAVTEVSLPVEQSSRNVVSGTVSGWLRDALKKGGLIRVSARELTPAVLFDRLRATAICEYEMGTGFLFIPVIAGAGVLIYGALASEPALTPLLVLTGLLLTAVLIALPRSFLLGLIVSVPLIALMGMASAKLQTMRTATPMVGSEIATQISGYVAQVEPRADGRTRLTIDITATAKPVLKYQPERVRLTMRRGPDLRAGDHITGRARLTPHYGPVLPGSYDFAYHAYFDGIGGNGFFLGRPEKSPPPLARIAFARFGDSIQNLRNGIAGRIVEAAGGGAPGTISAALVTGVTSAIPEDAQETLRATGLAHILSISGLHMALVAGIFLGALRAFMALFPSFSARHPVKKYAAIAALAGSSGYLMLAGSGVATERSFIMLAVMLIAVLFDRAALTMRNLAVAAILILAVSPHEVAGPSFQMSFAATAALIAVYTWFARRRTTQPKAFRVREGWLGRFGIPVLRASGAMTLTAIVGGTSTAIYSAYHFHAVSTVGFAANILTMPIISLIVMPAAVAGTLLLPLGLDGPFFALMGWGMDMVMAIATHIQTWSDSGVTGLVSGKAIVVVTAGFVVLALMQTGLRWLGFAFMAAGLAISAAEPHPNILIDEGGQLVAARQADSIAVNLARPNEFALGIWQKALGGLPVVKPVVSSGTSAPANGFVCDGSACVLRLPAWPAIVSVSRSTDLQRDQSSKPASDPGSESPSTAQTGRDLETWCGQDAIVLTSDASVRLRCADPRTLYVSARELALRGSAMIYLEKSDANIGEPSQTGRATDRYSMVHAYDRLSRPWTEHRRFSRAARGLPEWQPKAKTGPAGPANSTKGQ